MARIAVVDMERCVACGACENECPFGAVKIFKGCYAAVDSASCIGCGKCAGVCPACIIEIKERI